MPESRHHSPLVLQASTHTLTTPRERDHLPRGERLLVARRTSSEANAAVHMSSQRPMDIGMSGIPHSDWMTRLEVKKPSVTAFRPVRYHDGTSREQEDPQTDESMYSKQSDAPSVSEVDESSLEAAGVQQVATSPVIEIHSGLPLGTLHDALPRSAADVVSGEVSRSSKPTTGISMTSQKQEFRSSPEPELSVTSRKQDDSQLQVVVQGQQQVDVSGSVLAVGHQDDKVIESHQTSPATAQAITLDNSGRGSASKETTNDAIVVPSLENAWKSNSQTVTSNQLTEVASPKTETVELNRAEVTVPTVIGVSSSVSQQGNSSEHTSPSQQGNPRRRVASEEKTSIAKEDEDEDEWEKRRKQRSEERRQREEAAQRREQEELERLQAEQVRDLISCGCSCNVFAYWNSKRERRLGLKDKNS